MSLEATSAVASSSEPLHESLLGEVFVQIGVITAVFAVTSLYFLSRRWGHASALQQSLAEIEHLRKNPKAFGTKELQLHNGMDPKHPLLIGIKGRVLDVREGADYYGPDGPYKVMAGRDASKAFAMMSLKEEDAMADLSGVPAENLKILDDWYDKLTKKYPTVGCCAGNEFGYSLSEIDLSVEALKTGKSELGKED